MVYAWRKCQKKFSTFHAGLLATIYSCFVLDPCTANKQWVHEFHANLSIISFANPIIWILGVNVHFGEEQINNLHGLLNVDMNDFEVKYYELGSWMTEKMCLGKEVSWAVTKKGISMNDFTAKARIWLNTIFGQIFPYTHITVVTNMCSCMVACKLDNIPLNVGRLVISDIIFYKNHSGVHFLFPSLITEMCRRERVVEYPNDTLVHPGTPIYPTKIWGKGAPV